MQKALDATPSRSVRLLSLSFDVDRERQAELASYAAQHRAKPEHWMVAAPVSSTVNRRLLAGLGVVAISDGSGDYVHNGDIHLIDATGRVHGIHGFDRWPDALAAARALVDPMP
jgi:protein SCO1